MPHIGTLYPPPCKVFHYLTQVHLMVQVIPHPTPACTPVQGSPLISLGNLLLFPQLGVHLFLKPSSVGAENEVIVFGWTWYKYQILWTLAYYLPTDTPAFPKPA